MPAHTRTQRGVCASAPAVSPRAYRHDHVHETSAETPAPCAQLRRWEARQDWARASPTSSLVLSWRQRVPCFASTYPCRPRGALACCSVQRAGAVQRASGHIGAGTWGRHPRRPRQGTVTPEGRREAPHHGCRLRRGGRRFWAGQPGIREQWSANDAARSLPRALPVSAFPIPRRAPGCALGACPLRDCIAFFDIKTQRDGRAQARVDDNLVGFPLHRTLCARRDVT